MAARMVRCPCRFLVLSRPMLDRTTGMGSTDVVEVAGLAPWEGAGPWRVYNAKTGVTTEDQADEDGTLAWGHECEAFLRDWYCRSYSRHVVTSHPVVHPMHGWLWASPDGVDHPGQLGPTQYYEIKNVGSFMAHHWDRSDDDGIPHYVRGQVTIGMYCAEVRDWTVIAAIGGLPPRIYHVDYDAELAEMLVETGRKFWVDHVCARMPPPVDASDACMAYMRAKWPRDERPTRESTLHEDSLAAERIGAHMLSQKAEETKKRTDALLLDALGPHKAIVGDGWKLTSWVDKKTGGRRTRFTAERGGDE